MSEILAIIPARGGSKGIKDKNILDVLGKPLIQYTIDAAKVIPGLRIVCSTDSHRIKGVVTSLGIECHELRPSHLSTDEARTSDVVQYEVSEYEKRTGLKVGNILLLQPTSPLRTSQDIRDALAYFEKSQRNSLISCYEYKGAHPSIMYFQNDGDITPVLPGSHRHRRQEFGKCFVRNGAVYIVRRDFFMETMSLFEEGPALYEMPFDRSLNIDEPSDIEELKRILNEKNQNR